MSARQVLPSGSRTTSALSVRFFRGSMHGLLPRCLRFEVRVTTDDARLASGWWLAVAGRANPLDFDTRFHAVISSSRSSSSELACRNLHLPPPTPPALAAARRAPAFRGARSGAAGVDRVGRSGAVKRAQREPRDERESASARRGARATVGQRVGVRSPKGRAGGARTARGVSFGSAAAGCTIGPLA